ncbi:MAG: hypothetical protein BGO49_10235 [Planctomycetales bacterium 71-10]|nr:MAG: hypothetical protein BGO49_10235 [Planctomycetales bacterium 71-10]
MPAETVAALLAHSLAVYADCPALTDGVQTYRYGQLSEMARRIAAVRTAGPVGMCAQRDVAAVAAAMAVFRCGAPFLPIDSSRPPEQIDEVLATSRPGLLLVGSGNRPSGVAREARRRGVPVIPIADLLESAGASAPELAASADEPAYLLGTSGSTGTPRMVAGQQHSLVHYIRWQIDAVGAVPGDRYSQLAPLGFDFSFKEWLVPLCGGACVVVGPEGLRFDGPALLSWLARHQISVCCLIPTAFRALVRAAGGSSDLRAAIASLRLIMVSGEALRAETVREWQHLAGEVPALMNLYGPTESTVIKLYYPIQYPFRDPGDIVPLGWPIPGTRVEILDEDQTPLPAGHVGQISLISRDLAAGYLGDPIGTSGRFVHTGREVDSAEVTLLTGDRGLLTDDGLVHFRGRADRQVKRHGVRIELDEIEAAVASAQPADWAVVDVLGDPVRIIAVAVPGPDGPSSDGLRETLKARLPAHTMPDEIVLAPSLPKLATGKTDYARLLDAVALNRPFPPGAPRPEDVQESLAAIWAHVLGVSAIPLDANFFELGGDSVRLLDLLAHIRSALWPDLTLLDVFTHGTVQSLAEVIVRGMGGSTEGSRT